MVIFWAFYTSGTNRKKFGNTLCVDVEGVRVSHQSKQLFFPLLCSRAHRQTGFAIKASPERKPTPLFRNSVKTAPAPLWEDRTHLVIILLRSKKTCCQTHMMQLEFKYGRETKPMLETETDVKYSS